MSNDIRLVTAPSVYLVGTQTINGGALASFLQDQDAESWHRDPAASDAESLCEIAGRLCYQSFNSPRPGGNAAYLGHIVESGHGSVLEHAVFSLIITGISRSCAMELLRHRAGLSPSMRSQRYCDESDAAFVVPPAMLADHAGWVAWQGTGVGDQQPAWSRFERWLFGKREALRHYRRLYGERLLAAINAAYRQDGVQSVEQAQDWCRDHRDAATSLRKAARGVARSELPECVETKLFVTINARAARNVIEQRASRHADAEIRRLADVLLDTLGAAAPNLFADYTKHPLPDGTYEVETKHRKV